MKKNVFQIIVSLLFCFSCGHKKSVAPIEDGSSPSAALIAVRLISHSEDELVIGLDLAVFRDSENLEENLQTQNFSIDTQSVSPSLYYERLEVDHKKGNRPAAYSAVLLMDQSSSMGSSDQENMRISAAKIFSKHLGNEDRIMVWSFAGSRPYVYGTGFTNDTTLLHSYLDSLAGSRGGGTPLYASQDSALRYMKERPERNKALLTFTDGAASRSTYYAKVMDLSHTHQIPLFNIGLGKRSDRRLSEQALSSGGAFIFAREASQLISVFGNLGKLLNGSAHSYQTKWKITKEKGKFTKGTIQHEINIQLPYGDEPVELKVPFYLEYP